MDQPVKPCFALRNLSVLAYAAGFTLWAYKVNAGLTRGDLYASGFFADAEHLMVQTDMVMLYGAVSAVATVQGDGKSIYLVPIG